MAVLDVIIGYVRGLKGDTGETGATGATGEAATISVGTVSTAAYGQQAQVNNVGTGSAAVFDFVIPEGRPGEVLADMSNLTNNTITASTSEFPVPAVGDTGATLWGKVVKFFSDIRTAVNAKIDSSKITTSLAVTTTGSVADATVSKVLNDKITTLNDSFGIPIAYTPTISYNNNVAAPTVTNINFFYQRVGKMLFVTGRFYIVDLGGSGNASLLISLPSGFQVYPFPLGYVGVLGTFVQDAGMTGGLFVVKADRTLNTITVTLGAGGGYSRNKLEIGYYAVSAWIPLA